MCCYGLDLGTGIIKFHQSEHSIWTNESAPLWFQVEQCEAWGETVNCSDVFILGGVKIVEQGVSGLIISALAVIFVFVAVVGVIYMNGIKSSHY